MIPIGCALLLPLIAIGGAFFSRVFRDRSQVMREQGSNVMAVFEERLANVHLIKAYGTEGREAGAVDTASWKSYVATLKFVGFLLAWVVILTPPILLLVMSGLYHLFDEVIDQRITLGDVVLLMTYGGMLANPMGNLGATWVNLQTPIAGLRRVFSVLDRLDEDHTRGGDINPGKITSIEFRKVSIAYDDTVPVVRDISLELRAGELTALAGPERDRQNHDHLFDSAFSRTLRGRNSHQWNRLATNLARLLAREYWFRFSTGGALLAFDRRQHSLWRAGCD